MRYLFLLYGPGEPLPGPGTPEGQKMIGEWRTATEAMAKAGVLIDCGPLQPPAAATTVRVRDGETLLTDRPAAKIKEQFGGYTLISGWSARNARSRRRASRWPSLRPPSGPRGSAACCASSTWSSPWATSPRPATPWSGPTCATRRSAWRVR